MSNVDLLKIKSRFEYYLLSLEGVVGVGIGKNKILVYVEDTTDLLTDVIFRTLHGYPFEIINSGRFRALALQTIEVSRTDRVRPAPGGVSIGHPLIKAGTLGSRVFDLDGSKLILSNNHILAAFDTVENPSGVSQGNSILQPGVKDGGDPTNWEDYIGLLDRWVKLKEAWVNIVDCAVARPLNQYEIEEVKPPPEYDVADQILEIGVVNSIAEGRLELPTQNSGRSSGLTSGQITDVSATIQVDYAVGVETKTLTFTDQLLSSHALIPGDSGSLLCDMRNNAVGLTFAGSTGEETVGAHNKIGHVCNSLQVKFREPRFPIIPTLSFLVFAGLLSYILYS